VPEPQLRWEATSRRRELSQDELQTQVALHQSPVAERIPDHQDHHPSQPERSVSDASAGERPEPSPDASPEVHPLPERSIRPDIRGVGAGRWGCADRPEEAAAQDRWDAARSAASPRDAALEHWKQASRASLRPALKPLGQRVRPRVRVLLPREPEPAEEPP
jgi:hypothetical protein